MDVVACSVGILDLIKVVFRWLVPQVSVPKVKLAWSAWMLALVSSSVMRLFWSSSPTVLLPRICMCDPLLPIFTAAFARFVG